MQSLNHSPLISISRYGAAKWKAAWNRCWTGDRRRSHGLSTNDKCQFCLHEVETIGHLLLQCSYSRSICFQVLDGLGRPDLTPLASDDLERWWCSTASSWPARQATKVRALLLLVLRSIWLERNARIFRAKSRLAGKVLDSIVSEAERWKSVGFL